MRYSAVAALSDDVLDSRLWRYLWKMVLAEQDRIAFEFRISRRNIVIHHSRRRRLSGIIL